MEAYLAQLLAEVRWIARFDVGSCVAVLERTCPDYRGLHVNLYDLLLPHEGDYIHDMSWWRAIFEQTFGLEIAEMREMTCTREAWTDWVACDNEYARGDRAAVEAGALDYLSTIKVMLRKK